MSNKQDKLNYLAELTETSTPPFFDTLSEKELTELEVYVKSIVSKGEAGLDRLFESMSMMMKFIPNFILHAITPKYIEPSIAARITSKLTLKQALGVTTGLPIEYIGDTAAYLESQLAADILSGIKKNRAEQILAYLVNKHPLKTLDILEHVSKDLLKIAQPLIPNSLSERTGLSSARREILDKLQQL
tara:strand:+ start:3809 stop:4372 length:564 start_codon:yes stop_codon:yes gene_type:complete